jgi:hypothetical protein
MKPKQKPVGRATVAFDGDHSPATHILRDRARATRFSRPVAWFRQVAAVTASFLQEIFDESAYRRFLERNRISSSARAYAAFREENDRLRAQRPKCC